VGVPFGRSERGSILLEQHNLVFDIPITYWKVAWSRFYYPSPVNCCWSMRDAANNWIRLLQQYKGKPDRPHPPSCQFPHIMQCSYVNKREGLTPIRFPPCMYLRLWLALFPATSIKTPCFLPRICGTNPQLISYNSNECKRRTNTSYFGSLELVMWKHGVL
jgi:hypothetical protein